MASPCSPFEQVVEAMIVAHDEAERVLGKPLTPEERAVPMLQAALDTGLLSLVEERPELSKNDLRQVIEGEVRRYEPDLRKLAEDDSGHQPEGEPSGSPLEPEEIEAQPEGDPSEAAVNAGVRLLPKLYMGTAHTDYTAIRAILRAAYAIDHPQDRE